MPMPGAESSNEEGHEPLHGSFEDHLHTSKPTTDFPGC
ncbi:hypothetical protein ACPOL_2570 [Acidisarcina polymorpha]|uniref:Uncharacterized protein n=1 Tax=Acidisarcina polymorpha TaxID=2211140 RepID=A0A2Z5FYF8_9BACT|nr:hypothetical protein ACPOL_2570 [Acidisarcina polymorpha]